MCPERLHLKLLSFFDINIYLRLAKKKTKFQARLSIGQVSSPFLKSQLINRSV